MIRCKARIAAIQPRIGSTIRKSRVALAGLLVLLLTAGSAAADCRAEHVLYSQAGRTGVTARLVRAGHDGTAASDLHLIVATKSHAYRFRFQQSNGYGGITLEPVLNSGAPTDRPPDVSDIRFIPYRADWTEISDAPQAGGRPPSVIVLPDLGATLWYDAAALGGPQQRQTMSRSAFLLSGCERKAGRAKAHR